jgi:hypothetical protein
VRETDAQSSWNNRLCLLPSVDDASVTMARAAAFGSRMTGRQPRDDLADAGEAFEERVLQGARAVTCGGTTTSAAAARSTPRGRQTQPGWKREVVGDPLASFASPDINDPGDEPESMRGNLPGSMAAACVVWLMAGARARADEPARVELAEPAKSVEAGAAVHVDLVLKDGNGKLATSSTEITVNVETTTSSGKTVVTPVQFQPGSSRASETLPAVPAGLVRVHVAAQNHGLVDDAGVVVVRPERHAPRPVTASLLMEISARDAGGLFADGTEPATVSIFYMDGTPAPQDVHVWLDWHGCGEIAEQPVMIHKGTYDASVRWTARAPCDGKISIAKSSPKLPITGLAEAAVRFVRAIDIEASAPSEISPIDEPELSARLVDRLNHVDFAADVTRTLTFVSLSANLALEPPTDREIPSGRSSVTTHLLPRGFFEQGQVRLSMPGAISRTVPIRIDSTAIIVLTLGFGLFGVILGQLAKRKRRWPSTREILGALFVGETAAVLFMFLYVFKVVRKFDSPVVHSMISVPVVALGGAFGGWTAINFALTKFGLGQGEPKKRTPEDDLGKAKPDSPPPGHSGTVKPDSPPSSDSDDSEEAEPGSAVSGGTAQNGSSEDIELDHASRIIDDAVAELPELELPLDLMGSSFRPPSAETEARFREADRTLQSLLGVLQLVRDRRRLAAGLVKVALFYRHVGDYQTAIDRLDVAIQLDGDNPRSYDELGQTLSYQGGERASSAQEKQALLSRAEIALKRSLALRGKAPWAETLHALAWLYDERKQYGEAIVCYRKAKRAVKRVPDASYDQIGYNLACALTKAGDFDEALKELESVLKKKDFVEWAERDPDFERLRTASDEFQNLILRAKRNR